MEKERPKGIVEGYKSLNEKTRNIAIAVAFVAAAIGNAAIASIAFGSAFVDQAQIGFIDAFRKKNKEAYGRA